MHVIGPDGLVRKWSILIRDSEGGVALDRLAVNGDIGPGVIRASVAVEQVQHDRFNAHGQCDLQVQCGLQSQLDGVGPRLHDRSIDENQIRLVHDQLRNGGDNDEEAIVEKLAIVRLKVSSS